MQTIRVNAAKEHCRCKDPKEKKKGAPRFKRSVRSLTWSKSKGVRQNPIRETGSRQNRLKVPKLGEVKTSAPPPHRRPERGHAEKDGARLVLLYRL